MKPVRIEPYRRVLALPGMTPLLLVALFARVPLTATGVTLTLHVVLDLGLGYAAAGMVGALATIGSAVGAPLLGRLVDRQGLRLTLVITAVAEAIFWVVAPSLSYVPLVASAGVGGLLSLPVFSVVRQSIAAIVPEEQRRQAYALDSMSLELSFMIGPAGAVLLITQVSATATMYAVGTATVLSGVALFLLDPPVRGAGESVTAERVPRRVWLTPKLLAILVVTCATTIVLAGTDVAIVAKLREAGEVPWTGLVLGVWGGYSLAGGFVYGALHRTIPPAMLVGLLGLLTVPVGLADGWGWLALALIPAGALCAPTLAAVSEAVSRLVPAGARGEAMGWHGSALTFGLAVGSPLAGAVIDASSPGWGFVTVGLLASAVALALLSIQRHSLLPGVLSGPVGARPSAAHRPVAS